MLPLLLGAAAAPVVGGIVGNLFSSGDRDAAQAASRQALESITGVSLPTIEEQKIALQHLVSQGQLTPEMLETITQGNTELAGVSTDPRLAQAQMNALSSLSKQGEEGLSASDRAALNQVRRETGRDVKGRNDAVLQNMGQRGMGGSGAELAAQLLNSQEGADRASQESDRLAAMAQERQLQAIMNSGILGGQIRQQEYGEKSAAAQAQDAINKFNAANSQNVAQYNVGGRNEAQKYNLGEKQRIADTNVGLGNQQEVHNKGLIQQDYQNRLGKATQVANAQNNYANTLNGQATQTANMWTGVGQGVGQAAGAAGGYMAKNPMQSETSSPSGTPSNDDWYNWAQKKAHGGMVEGPEVVPGDDEQNDVVPVAASAGEIVIPKSIVGSSDDAILDFIRHVKRASKRG